MNLRSLKYFIAVAEELSFTRGASRVHIEQAPLSQSIRRLEKEIGTKLFFRNTRGVELTAEGLVFLDTARTVVDTLSDGLQAAKNITHGLRERLTIGFVASAAFDFVPKLARDFKISYPQTELSLRQLGSEEQIELLGRRELDGAFVRPRQLPRTFACIPVSRVRFVCAVWSGHPLAKRRQVHMSELRDEPFLMLTSEPKTHVSAQVASIFNAAGFSPSTVMETNFFHTMIELVDAGLGIAIVPTTIRELNIKGVRFLELKDVKTEAGMDFIWREGSISAPLLNLIRVIKRHTNLSNKFAGQSPPMRELGSIQKRA
jgi:DNA-binding transcriptional LysR family regulator